MFARFKCDQTILKSLIQIKPIHLDTNCTQRLSANECGQTQTAWIKNRPDKLDLDQALQYGFRSGPTILTLIRPYNMNLDQALHMD